MELDIRAFAMQKVRIALAAFLLVTIAFTPMVVVEIGWRQAPFKIMQIAVILALIGASILPSSCDPLRLILKNAGGLIAFGGRGAALYAVVAILGSDVLAAQGVSGIQAVAGGWCIGMFGCALIGGLFAWLDVPPPDKG